MSAAVSDSRSNTPGDWVSIEDISRPQPQPRELLLKVIAWGVCRTDLHIVEADPPSIRRASSLVSRSPARCWQGRPRLCRWARAPASPESAA